MAHNIDKLAKEILRGYENCLEEGIEHSEYMDQETYLGVQYSYLHSGGAVVLTDAALDILNHAKTTLTQTMQEN